MTVSWFRTATRPHGHQRRRPGRRRVLQQLQHPFSMTGKKRRRPAQRRQHLLGLLRGRFRPDPGQRDRSTGCKRQTTSAVVKASKADYVAHSPAVPVLRLDLQPDAHASAVGVRHRFGHRAGRQQQQLHDRHADREPSVRYARLLRRDERQQYARRQLPQGAGVPDGHGRIFRSARRADLHHRGYQRAGEAPGVVHHGRGHRL